LVKYLEKKEAIPKLHLGAFSATPKTQGFVGVPCILIVEASRSFAQQNFGNNCRNAAIVQTPEAKPQCGLRPRPIQTPPLNQ
jgi:hypothetical protein